MLSLPKQNAATLTRFIGIFKTSSTSILCVERKEVLTGKLKIMINSKVKIFMSVDSYSIRMYRTNSNKQ